MDRKKFLLWEKAQVLLTAGVLMAVVYYLLWRYFLGADPLGPLALLPGDNFARMLLAGGVLCVLSAVAGVTTTRSRPEGAILAALLATGGLAPLFHAATPVIEHVDADLTIRGLREIYRRNRERPS